MNVAELAPQPSTRVLFKLLDFRKVPKIAGCYILSTFNGAILYIGLSVDLNKRFQQHLDNPGKIGLTENGKAFWFHFSEYDKNNLPKLERTWLNQYQTTHGRRPILNKADSPVS